MFFWHKVGWGREGWMEDMRRGQQVVLMGTWVTDPNTSGFTQTSKPKAQPGCVS